MSTLKILILGGSGMLGHKLFQKLSGGEFEVFATLRQGIERYEHFELFDRARCFGNVDALSFQTVSDVVSELKPDVLINAIGLIKQKRESADPLLAIELNAAFPHRLRILADELGARLITFSTDCVFDGRKGNYTESDRPSAEDLYGRTKLLGEVTEANSLTLRTSIIGRELVSSDSLVEWFLRNSGDELRGFVNAFYTGFPTIVLADIIREVVLPAGDLSGLFHVSSERITKYELLCILRDKLGLRTVIVPYEGYRVDRSLDSTKFRDATGYVPPVWNKMIDQMLEDPTPYEIWRKQTI